MRYMHDICDNDDCVVFLSEKLGFLPGQAVDFLRGACVGKVPASTRKLGGESGCGCVLNGTPTY